MNLFFPSRITSDFEGYNSIISIYQLINDSWDDEIVFDFQNTSWFEANLSAILGALMLFFKERSKVFKVKNLSSQLEDVLSRNHFLCEFNFHGFQDEKRTTITYREFTPYQDIEFINYIENELLSKPDFPKHSKMLGRKINESIFEIFENARTSGDCKHIITCGQYYPNKRKGKRLDITIVDLGNTIKKNVNEFLKSDIFGYEAIEWAMQYGNTTKTGSVSGGLGLDIVFDFIKLNKGKFQIVSSDGYWEYSKGNIVTNTFNQVFPGTIVNIEFNLDDPKSYYLKEEVSLDNIF